MQRNPAQAKLHSWHCILMVKQNSNSSWCWSRTVTLNSIISDWPTTKKGWLIKTKILLSLCTGANNPGIYTFFTNTYCQNSMHTTWTHTHSHTHACTCTHTSRISKQCNWRKVFKKRKVFKEDLKELTEAELCKQPHHPCSTNKIRLSQLKHHVCTHTHVKDCAVHVRNQ